MSRFLVKVWLSNDSFNLVKFLGSFKYGKIVPFFLTIFYSYLKAPLQEEGAFSN
jgi:hypothetical protein